MKLRNALLAATILAAPIAVSAQPVSGVYIGLGAGGNILQTETISHTAGIPALVGGRANQIGAHSNIRFDLGPVVIGSVGYGLGNGLRLELQGAFYDNKLTGLKAGGPTSAGGDEYKEGAFLNVFYDLAIPGVTLPVQPYVGVGAGYVHNQFNSLRITSVAPGEAIRGRGENDNIGVQGIAGFAFPITAVPGLALTAEYRFLGEVNGRDYHEQLFTSTGAFPARLKEGADDFNHSILLGVRYAFGAPTPPPPPPPVQPAPAPAPTRTYLVFFDWDRADLTDRARQIVAEAAQASTKVQYTRIEVQGNADRSGTPAYNQRLSLRRAQTVAAELVRLGVPRTAIDIQAFGDTRPLVPTAPGVREPQNRRVAIILR